MRTAARLVSISLLCAPLAQALWPYLNRKLTTKQVTIRKVVVLPAQVSFNKVGVHGSEGGIPQGEQVAETFYAAVAKELAARGVDVAPNPLSAPGDDKDRYPLADVQARYDNVAVQLRRKPGRVATGEYTLGDRVAQFGPGTGIDALVFVRGRGEILTNGRRAISWMTWGSGLDEFHGEVTLVDAKTGEVLAFLRFQRQRNMTENSTERFAETLREGLYDVPLPVAPSKK